MISKSRLAIELSKLRVFDNPKIKSEQYVTDSEIASAMLSQAQMLGDITGKTIADFGSGTGILGIGGMILGAKKVYFVENDKDVVKTLKANIDSVQSQEFTHEHEIIVGRVEDFDLEVDVIVQNPPFGTKVKHSDRVFLGKAMTLAPVIYSMHKSTSEGFIESFTRDSGYKISHSWEYDLPLKPTLKHHKKWVFYAKVRVYRFVRQG